MKSVAAFAFGVLAFSLPAFASEQAAGIAARDAIFPDSSALQVEKRWGNWHNHGNKCHGNYMCKTNVWMARPSCSADGVCGFKCLHGYQKQGWKCVPPHHEPQCSKHKHCDIKVKNADAWCYNGKCTFKCWPGYHRQGDWCVKNEKKCDSNSCYPVADGYSTCEDGKCSYHCATYLGYTLFTNSKKTAYRCVNLENDADNCGSIGNMCQTGYNGKGYPYCEAGECQLNCAGYNSKETMDGMPYCTDSDM